MPHRLRSLLVIGGTIGVLFGGVNLVYSWWRPTSDDTPGALLGFYGPMFLLWALVAYRAARRRGRLLSGIAAGCVVAFGTFWTYSLFNAVRVNLFLEQLTARPDWQDMMMRFRASGEASLRSFINDDYLRGTPSKLLATEVIGTMMGTAGSVAGWLSQRTPAPPPV